MDTKKQRLTQKNNNMNNNLEIERKFLLKNIPKFKMNEIKKYSIHQIYVDIDGKIHRFRMSKHFNNNSTDEMHYVHCVKTPISHGVFEEIESKITPEEFINMTQKDHTYIVKTRYVYEYGGLKWEVDEYHDIKLVTLEVELSDINQEIIIPEIIENMIIVEITGQKAFSNQNLSIKVA